MVDINNYKVDRYDKVMQIASRIARTVQRTKISATLDPMPNDERKVVHQFLSEMKNISGKIRRVSAAPQRAACGIYSP